MSGFRLRQQGLYRYRSDEECKLKELQDSTVYLADPKSFNDPFESAYAKNFEYELKNLQKNPKFLSELDKKKLAKAFNGSKLILDKNVR